MPPVDNNPIKTQGYYHHKNDELKSTTALRATYNPSLSDRFVNRFARFKDEGQTPRAPGEQSKMVKTAHAVRKLDLLIRKSLTKNRLDSARNKLTKMEKNEADKSLLATQQQKVDHLEHVDYRLDDKQAHADAALKGKLDDEIASSNAKLKTRLEGKGYVPLKDLSEVKVDTVQSRYLISPEDHHRIQVHSNGPSTLSRLIASTRSADLDRGKTGVLPRSRSMVQHALVGIGGLMLSAEAEATRILAKHADLDDGARARMEGRTERALLQKDELQDSLGGNESLKRSHQRTVDSQIESAKKRVPAPDARDVDNGAQDSVSIEPGYVTRSARNGVKPLQTRAWERRIDAYFNASEGSEEVATQDAETRSLSTVDGTERGTAPAAAESQPRRGRLARFAERVSNARDDHNLRKTAGKLALAKVKLDPSQSTKRQERNKKRIDHYEVKAKKTEFQREARRSMWQGKLMDTLNGKEFKEWENETFKQQRELHEELPWKPAEQPVDKK